MFKISCIRNQEQVGLLCLPVWPLLPAAEGRSSSSIYIVTGSRREGRDKTGGQKDAGRHEHHVMPAR